MSESEKCLRDEYIKNVAAIGNQFIDIYLIDSMSGDRIASNRMLLASQSQVFKGMFLEDGIDREDDGTVTINDVSWEHFKIVNNYMLHSTLTLDNVSIRDIICLFQLSDRFQIDSARRYIIHHLRCNISQVNCWEIFELSAQSDDGPFSDFCAQFISQNIKNVSDNANFLALTPQRLAFLLQRNTFYVPEEDIFRAVLKWYLIFDKKNSVY
jgi:BTB/POZ domain-containing protein 9